MTMAEIRETNRAKQSRPWTSKEIAALRACAHLGANEAAALLDRTVQAVRLAAHRHRISLRQPGSRAGIALGQPRGVSWARLQLTADECDALDEIRAGVVDGTLDVADLERLAAGGALIGELCPSCARYPQVERLGICEVCHLKRLAAAHREDQAHQRDVRAAQQELDRERQAKSRRRRREAAEGNAA